MNANIMNAMQDALNCGQISQEAYNKFMADYNDEYCKLGLANHMEHYKTMQTYRNYKVAFVFTHIISWSMLVACCYFR